MAAEESIYMLLGAHTFVIIICVITIIGIVSPLMIKYFCIDCGCNVALFAGLKANILMLVLLTICLYLLNSILFILTSINGWNLLVVSTLFCIPIWSMSQISNCLLRVNKFKECRVRYQGQITPWNKRDRLLYGIMITYISLSCISIIIFILHQYATSLRNTDNYQISFIILIISTSIMNIIMWIIVFRLLSYGLIEIYRIAIVNNEGTEEIVKDMVEMIKVIILTVVSVLLSLLFVLWAAYIHISSSVMSIDDEIMEKHFIALSTAWAFEHIINIFCVGLHFPSTNKTCNWLHNRCWRLYQKQARKKIQKQMTATPQEQKIADDQNQNKAQELRLNLSHVKPILSYATEYSRSDAFITYDCDTNSIQTNKDPPRVKEELQKLEQELQMLERRGLSSADQPTYRINENVKEIEDEKISEYQPKLRFKIGIINNHDGIPIYNNYFETMYQPDSTSMFSHHVHLVLGHFGLDLIIYDGMSSDWIISRASMNAKVMIFTFNLMDDSTISEAYSCYLKARNENKVCLCSVCYVQ